MQRVPERVDVSTSSASAAPTAPTSSPPRFGPTSGAFAPAAVLLAGVEVTRRETVVEAGDDDSVLAGLRAIRRDCRQVGLLVETVTAAFGFTAYFAFLLVSPPASWVCRMDQLGTALGVGAIGAVAGSALSGRVSRRIGVGPAVIAGAFVYAGALLAVPLAPRHDPLAATVVIAAAEFVSAAAMVISEIPAASIQQAITPAGQLGRVRGVSLAANYGARTLEALPPAASARARNGLRNARGTHGRDPRRSVVAAGPAARLQDDRRVATPRSVMTHPPVGGWARPPAEANWLFDTALQSQQRRTCS